MKIVTTKKYWRIWSVTVNGRTFEIDGQNHEFTSREWQLFEVINDEHIWCSTLPTKRNAIEVIEEIISKVN